MGDKMTDTMAVVESDKSVNESSDLKGHASSHNVECGDRVEHDMTPEEETKLVRKMDLNIFPVLIALYILSFLDRVNIGKLVTVYLGAVRH